MYAIFDKNGNKVSKAFDTKTGAWDDYRERVVGDRGFNRSSDLSRYRRQGYYVDWAGAEWGSVGGSDDDSAVYLVYKGKKYDVEDHDFMTDVEDIYNKLDSYCNIDLATSHFAKAVRIAIMINEDRDN